MATKGKANARLTKDLLETAKDMRASGSMDKEAHEKITMRHLGDVSKIPTVVPIKRHE
jgi:putative transcriptional regulator